MYGLLVDSTMEGIVEVHTIWFGIVQFGINYLYYTHLNIILSKNKYNL